MPIIDIELIEEKINFEENDLEFIEKIISPYQKNKKVILIGQVQSGKTRAIEKCIYKAPKYYDAVIVFGGTNNLLNNQTKDRFDCSSNLKSKNVTYFTAKELLENNLIAGFWNKNIFPVMIVLKGYEALKNINRVFEEILLPNKRVLIIDDESDFASVNIGREARDSEIYTLIQKLLGNIELYTELEVTATPFANLLSKVKYDEIYLLPTNPQYTGSKFFVQNEEKYQIIESNKNDSNTWERSMEESLVFWLISTSIYILKTQKRQKSEFLINIDLKKPTHEYLKKMLINKLIYLRRYPSIFLNSNAFNYYSISDEAEKSKIINFCKEIINDLLNNINKKIIILNSETDSDKYKSGRFNFCIVIGGALISRGVTFENLLTELILNSPDEWAALDTTLQRARWFGYRHEKDEMQKYMTIFVNKEILMSYKKADEAIDFLNSCYYLPNIKQLLLTFAVDNLKPFKIRFSNKRGQQ